MTMRYRSLFIFILCLLYSNAKYHEVFCSKKFNVFLCTQHLGQSFDVITKLRNGSHPFCATLKEAKKPLVILGAEQLSREDGAKILYETQELAKALGDNIKVIYCLQSFFLYHNFIQTVITINFALGSPGLEDLKHPAYKRFSSCCFRYRLWLDYRRNQTTTTESSVPFGC